MPNTIIIAALVLLTVACTKATDATARSEAPRSPIREDLTRPTAIGAAPTTESRKLFLDEHELGKGKVTRNAVAEAHQKDLTMQKKYGVSYQAYWVDEDAGKIFCLAEAPSAAAANAVHKEAHGLVATKIMEVTADNTTWAPAPGKNLYLDVHHFPVGKVTAADVAGAHAKDLAVEDKHGVRYLNYWFDAQNGTVMCLAEAASAEAAMAVHKEAHGLMPESIEQVYEAR